MKLNEMVGQTMPMYERGDADGIRVIDRWEDGIDWLAHPGEDGHRASHAVRGPDGDVWLFDPLNAPGVDELVAELGEVAGVAVFSNWHARDADSFARRHDVTVHLPRWMDRIAERVDAPVQRYGHEVGSSGFHVRRCSPPPRLGRSDSVPKIRRHPVRRRRTSSSMARSSRR
ncbi:hypothetical protein V5735_14470 (plasmid) [Haladaptatus sp. SPP-AMP-3]|uniref:hypothetical protein n=1 Tax=Haladaptatus sp. SPP-AMP-3 TaxID=3121295 RepID=UPI003C2D39D6